MKLLLLTARRVARAAAPAAVNALRPPAPLLQALSVPHARFLSDKPRDEKPNAKLFASQGDDSDSSDSDSDSDSEEEEEQAADEVVEEVEELLPIDEEGISTAERRRRLDAFLEHNAEFFDEERYGAQDGDKWFGFDGNIDGVTGEGVPTWLQSVRDMVNVEEERAIRAKSARIAFHEAKNKIVRVRKLDEKGRAYGTGRRKTSTARVWIKPSEKPFNGRIQVNKKDLVDYFVRDTHREEVLKPFSVVDKIGGFDVYCTVKGGGSTGQAGAVRHGIARALQNFDPEMRPALKQAGLMTRDSRMVERKKPGQPKARKKFQWVKR
jgi:small subunit ribosomal protein S9